MEVDFLKFCYFSDWFYGVPDPCLDFKSLLGESGLSFKFKKTELFLYRKLDPLFYLAGDFCLFLSFLLLLFVML